MLGGGSHNWAFTYSQDLLGKANPTGEDTAAAEYIAHIFITGNTVVGSDAEKGRGGGIGNNGLLEIGEKEPHSFALKKVDEETGADLSGAVFLLEGTTVSGRELKVEKITEAGGYAEFTNLPFGTYTLTEKEAPKDYELSNRVLTLNIHAGSGVTLTENGEALPLVNGEFGWEYTFTNKAEEELPGLKIELYKTGYSQETLEGAEFELYSSAASESERVLIGKETTGRDGLASWKGLEPGNYILIETEAPKGYLKYEKEIELTLAEDGTLMLSGEVKDNAVVISNTAKGRVTVRDESETYTLPATGGSGTTIFIMAGLMLMAAAGCLLYRKQRKTKH
jgi:LPXTG-motif cell wall-anchored protein